VIDVWQVTSATANATILDTLDAEGFYQLLTHFLSLYS
jgi:inosine-uridine nucleoside N-ribohydrolase